MYVTCTVLRHLVTKLSEASFHVHKLLDAGVGFVCHQQARLLAKLFWRVRSELRNHTIVSINEVVCWQLV